MSFGALSPLKLARLTRRLNKLVGLPANAPADRLLAKIRVLQRAGALSVDASSDPPATAVRGVGVGIDLALIEQLAAGLSATPCAAALRSHAKRAVVALPEPLDALRRAAQADAVHSNPAARLR